FLQGKLYMQGTSSRTPKIATAESGTNISLDYGPNAHLFTAYSGSAQDVGLQVQARSTIASSLFQVVYPTILPTNVNFYEGTTNRATIDMASAGFRITSLNSLYLEATGNVRSTTARATTLGDSARRPLFINPNGSIGIESSSRSSKLNIESHEFSVDAYLELDTRSWVWKKGVEGYADLLSRKAEGEDVDEEKALDQIISNGGLGRGYGMIAEEVEEAGFSEFVIHDEDGSCSGLRYDQLWLPLHSVAKQHHSRIAELEDELATVKAQLASL